MKIKSIILALALVGFSITSCDKYLDEKLVSFVAADSYYGTGAGLEDAVDATYSYLKYIYTNERSFSLTTFGTDAHTNGADGGYKSFNYYDNTLNSSWDILQQVWDACYKGVNMANAVLERGEAVQNEAPLTPEIWGYRQAEVRFLRAFYYFYLVRTWGGNIPLSLEEIKTAQVTATPSTEPEIYDAIVADAEYAIANLKKTPDTQYGRAWMAPAQYLLGQVLATRSYKSFALPDDASRSEAMFTAVISNPLFALETGVDRVFNQDNQKNKEVVFAIQYSSDAILNGPEGNRGHLYFIMEYDTQVGMQRDIANGRPFKRFRPTEYLLSVYAKNRDNDLRYDQSYKHAWFCNNSNNIPVWTEEQEALGAKNADGSPAKAGQKKYSLGDTSMFIPGPGREDKWTPEEKKKVRYSVFTSSDFSEKIFPTLNKWMDPKRPTIQWEPGSRDMFIMRLGDAYLMRAEMRLKQGNTSGAAEDINVLRTRSARPGRVAENQITAADVTLDFILDERMMELDGEQYRWFDLARTGKLVERAKLNKQVTGVEEFHNRRPIPQTQIDRTQGGYPQNCGYKGGVCPGG
jgi:hypothetical protein